MLGLFYTLRMNGIPILHDSAELHVRLPRCDEIT